jgi:hypothetical protein
MCMTMVHKTYSKATTCVRGCACSVLWLLRPGEVTLWIGLERGVGTCVGRPRLVLALGAALGRCGRFDVR